MGLLHDLYAAHQGKVSDKWTLYLTEYDRLFLPYRERPIALLEIGVQNGGSLELWARYFPHARALVGCDIDQACAALRYDDPRIAVVVGDATTDEAESQILRHADAFDLIIDDGSHSSGDIVKAFARYFPRLRPGGLFVAEDLHCSYWQTYQGGLYYPYSSVAFFKRLADVVNYDYWGIRIDRAAALAGFGRTYGISLSEEALAAVHSVEFLDSMCVIRRQEREERGLGPRVVAGLVEDVVSITSQDRGFAEPCEEGNRWATLGAAPDEGFDALNAQITALNQHGARLADEVERLTAALDASRAEGAALAQAVADEQQHRAEAMQHVERLTGDLEASRAQSAALTQAVADEQQHRAEAMQHVERLTGDLEASRAQSAALTQAVADEQQHRAEAMQHVERLTGELEAERRLRESSAAELATILQSGSWKLTAPLRKVRARFRR